MNERADGTNGTAPKDADDFGQAGGRPEEGDRRPRPDQAVRADEEARTRLFAAHQTLAELYGLEHLKKDRTRELLSLAALPKWEKRTSEDRDHDWGHGFGKDLDNALNRISPGYMLGVAAAAAKAGKTAFLHQIADGLALRSAELLLEAKSGPLTPVVMLSEMSPRDLSWRSLARMAGYPVSWIRAGKGAESLAHGDRAPAVQEMWGVCERLLSEKNSLFGLARTTFVRVFQSPGTKGTALLSEIDALVGAWRRDLAREYKREEREIWPVVMLDPVQRLPETGKDAVGQLDAFVDQLNTLARKEGQEWIVLLTSDATKVTATGGTEKQNLTLEQEGASAFRGSYTLQHTLDAGLYLSRASKEEMPADQLQELDALVVFNRWGPAGVKARLKFDRPRMRIYASGRQDNGGERISFSDGARRGR